MREMKNGDVEWLPQIPFNWTRARLKDVISVLTDYTANGSFADLAKNVEYHDYIDYARLVRLTDLRDNLENPGIYVDEKSYKYLEKSKLFGNEILVANVGAYAGLFCEMPPIDIPATLGPNMFLIRTNKRMLNHYLYYLGNTRLVWNQLAQKSFSSAQPKLNKTDVKTIQIVFPSIKQQQQIITYLDTKCAEIDSIAEDIRKEIETLQEYRKSVITEAVTKGLDPDVEMKDSGILWAPQVPQSWQVSRIGYVCQKLERHFSPDDIPLLCTNRGKISIRPEEMVGIMVSQDNAMQGIRKGDIAIHGMDTWHGAIAISDIDGKITRVVHVCDSYGDNRFIVYYLQSLAFNNVYKLISNGVRGNTSDFRSWNKVEHILVPIPNIDEQNIICDYLDAKCAEIDSIIADKQKQLDILAEYRKSLIYEYVTGKKEVV